MIYIHYMYYLKFLKTFEMWCWRRMEETSRTYRVRNEEVLWRVKEERNVVYKIQRRKANCIGHILRRNCLLKHFVEGNVRKNKVKTRRRRRCKQLLNDLKEKRGYCKLKDEAVDSTPWKTRFGRGCGAVVR